MNGAEKAGRLKAMLAQVGSDRLGAIEMPSRDARVAALEGLAYDAAVAAPDSSQLAMATAIGKLKDDRDDELTPQEFDVLEAIVLPRERPVVFVTGQRENPSRETYEIIEDPWTHLNGPDAHAMIDPVLGSVGRVEVPRLPWVPYGGTAFVVGAGLLMTNRHVAKLFCDGRGVKSLTYTAGDAAIDFQRRRDTPANQSVRLDVVSVVMIHPYWDMALMRVEGIPATVTPLRLSIAEPDTLRDQDVVAIGYPARDDRNDLELQDRIFQRQYNVKRLQPGKLRVRAQIRSFENVVPAMTHDASTLGGNSGSAVVSVRTGQVVGLHFAGLYLKANYAVPTYELARDSRVVAAGLNFAGTVAPTTAWDPAWAGLESMPSPLGPGAGGGAASAAGSQPGGSSAAALQTPTAGGTTAVFTVPMQIAVSFGSPQLATGIAASVAAAAAPTEAPRFQVPIIHDGLEHRTGYHPNDLDGHIPLPSRTALGKQVTAKLDDGSDELKYHKFSVVMHKGRRLALLTAANVDWRSQSRLINGKKPSRQELTGIPEGTLEEWVTDWRISEDHQLPDIFFTEDRKSFDKGHVVRRDDVAWGTTFDDMQMANGDTYHTPNCTPQTSAFNQGSKGVDNWGDLETLIQQETKAEKAIVFGGPVLASNDPFFDGVTADGAIKVKIPRKFWKIVVVKDGQGAAAYGFVLKHDLSDVQMRVEEFTVPAQWQRFMEPIEEIEKLLKGLATLDQLKTFDRFGADESVRIRRQL